MPSWTKRATSKLLLPLVIAAGVTGLTHPAAAQEPAENKPTEGEVAAGDITIVGRVQRPIATVDVGRIPPKMTLAKLRQPFLERIEQAIYRAPF